MKQPADNYEYVKISLDAICKIIDGLSREDIEAYSKDKWVMLGASPGFPAFVQVDAPDELKKRVLAAVISYAMGVKSIDRVKKQYFPEET